MSVKCPKCDTENTSDSQFCKKCATPLPFPIDLSVTKTLETPAKGLTLGSTFAGRYQIVQELGKGGMGAVYKALDTQINEEVAIKLIRPEIAADEKTLERFSNELKLARKISHKNVCRMYHLEKGEEIPYISMEYLEGEDLKKLIREKEKLPAEKAIGIAQQVCEGLVEAHRLGVVHRDLKPQNIMIDKDGQAKIMDFGIARSVEAPGVTQTGVIIGTPDYISPEQAEGQEADERADIYSLGVILYEMVTGSVPFKGDTALSVALKHKAQLPMDPRKSNPEIPDDLSRLILICMEKDRNRRYQSAKDLLDDLHNIEQGLPLGTKIRPHRQTFISSLVRNKLFIPALVMVLAIIAVAIWQLWPQKDGLPALPSDRPSLAILYFENNTGDESLDNWRDSLSSLLITDLSQSKYLHVLTEDRIYGVMERLDLLDKEKYSSDDLKKVAIQAGCSHVLTGNYITLGDQFIITISLQDPYTSEAIKRIKTDGIGVASIQESIDKITPQVKAALNLSDDQIAADYDKKVSDITTSSPEALRHYNQAMQLRIRGEARQALGLLEKAIELDPDFAMAYRSMWMIYHSLGNREKRDEAKQKVKELKDRLPLREKLFLEQNLVGGFGEKRYQILKKILEDYPEDALANSHFADVCILQEKWDECVEQLELFLRSANYKDSFTYGYLANGYRAKGLYDKAEKLLKSYLENVEEIGPIRYHLALTYACHGKYDLALFEIEKAISLLPNNDSLHEAKGNIHLLKGEFEDAEIEYRKMVASDNVQLNRKGSKRLGYLYIWQGQYGKAKEEADKAIAKGDTRNPLFVQAYSDIENGRIQEGLDKFDELWVSERKTNYLKPHLLWWKGIFSLKANLVDEAQKALEDFKAETVESSDWGSVVRDALYLQAEIELMKGNYSEAIDFLEEAISLLPQQHSWSAEGSGITLRRHADPQCMFMSLLGSAHYQKGDLENARRVYEKITGLTTGRLRDGDKYAKAFYMLGKVYEQLDWPGKAIENYEKILELWKDADPGLPEVEDAKKRLASLRSN